MIRLELILSISFVILFSFPGLTQTKPSKEFQNTLNQVESALSLARTWDDLKVQNDTLSHYETTWAETAPDSILAFLHYLQSKSSLMIQDISTAFSKATQGLNLCDKEAKSSLAASKNMLILTTIYSQKAEYDSAIIFAEKAIEIQKKVIGQNSRSYGSALNELAVIYYNMGDYTEAATHFKRAKEIFKETVGRGAFDYILATKNLGLSYMYSSKYEKSLPYLEETLELSGQVWGTENANYADALNNLGSLYLNTNQFDKARPVFNKVKEILERETGKEHLMYATCLANLSYIYEFEGAYEQAEAIGLEAKSILERTVGKKHNVYLATLNQLGSVYDKMGNQDKSEAFANTVIDVYENELNITNHPFYISTLLNLSILFISQKKYAKAESNYKKLIEIQNKYKQTKSPNYLECLSQLARVYIETGKFQEADKLISEAEEIEFGTGWLYHSVVRDFEFNAGLVNLQKKNEAKTIAHFNNYAEKRKDNLIRGAKFMSEEELTKLILRQNEDLNQYFSIVETNKENMPSLIPLCYDFLLNSKSFALTSSKKIKSAALKDSSIANLYDSFLDSQEELSDAYSDLETEALTLQHLEEKTNTIEKELTLKIAMQMETPMEADWTSIQSALNEGEAAIEFFNYQYSTYENSSERQQYVAIVLLKDSKTPFFVPLFQEKQMLDLLEKAKNNGGNLANNLYAWTSNKNALSDLIWKPLQVFLKDIKKVYYAPSGLLHQINLSAIPTSKNAILADNIALIHLNSTREVITHNPYKAENKTAWLYGSIQYSMDSSAINNANSIFTKDAISMTRGFVDFVDVDSTLRGGDEWGYLESTNEELEIISKRLTNADFSPRSVKDYTANETVFKSMDGNSPRIVHIATHGYFFPNKKHNGTNAPSQGSVFKKSKHPMIRSGLILAGGNYAWKKGQAYDSQQEDGILTAYEISQLDLSQTELVVLSACETGLGDIKGSEGVYGLQRAFKMAGAQNLIMSLWQVSDFHTKELMDKFYKNWLEHKMGVSEALTAAQNEMRKQGYAPFYWAGFVVLE